MQTNELKNAVATPHHTVVNVGEGSVADDLTLSKVNQCPRYIYTGTYIYMALAQSWERNGWAPLWPVARASFRQFFKIKSLSVLVKRASRAQPVSTPDSLSCPALPPVSLSHPLRGFARTSIHVLRLMTDSCRPKKVCKSVVERPRASMRASERASEKGLKKGREIEEEALEARTRVA